MSFFYIKKIIQEIRRILSQWKCEFADRTCLEPVHKTFTKLIDQRDQIENTMIKKISESESASDIADIYYDLETAFPECYERCAIIMLMAQTRIDCLLYKLVEHKREELENKIKLRIEKCEDLSCITDIEKIYCCLKDAFPTSPRPDRITSLMQIASQRYAMIRGKVTEKSTDGI